MAQNIVRLPESAVINAGRWLLTIKNHAVITKYGLFTGIAGAIREGHWDEVLKQLKSGEFSYESVLEQCVAEIETNQKAFTYAIWWNYDADLTYTKAKEFIKTDAGVSLGIKIVDNIRDCSNWDELYKELHPKSKFSRDIQKIIKRET